MLTFKDDKDGYYQFADDAPPEWYAHLTPCAPQVPPPPTPQQQRDAIQAQIEAIEGPTERDVREFMIYKAEQEFVAMGAAATTAVDAVTSLQIAYETNVAYRKRKDQDALIVALRNQMDAII